MTLVTEPRYWMHEASGILRPVVEAYLRHRRLDATEIAIMRDYLCQWVDATGWDCNPYATKEHRAELKQLRAFARRISTLEDIDECLRLAGDSHMDPL